MTLRLWILVLALFWGTESFGQPPCLSQVMENLRELCFEDQYDKVKGWIETDHSRFPEVVDYIRQAVRQKTIPANPPIASGGRVAEVEPFLVLIAMRKVRLDEMLTKGVESVVSHPDFLNSFARQNQALEDLAMVFLDQGANDRLQGPQGISARTIAPSWMEALHARLGKDRAKLQ